MTTYGADEQMEANIEGYVVVNNNGGQDRCMAGVGVGGDKDIFETYAEAVRVRDELRAEFDNSALEVYELRAVV